MNNKVKEAVAWAGAVSVAASWAGAAAEARDAAIKAGASRAVAEVAAAKAAKAEAARAASRASIDKKVGLWLELVIWAAGKALVANTETEKAAWVAAWDAAWDLGDKVAKAANIKADNKIKEER